MKLQDVELRACREVQHLACRTGVSDRRIGLGFKSRPLEFLHNMMRTYMYMRPWTAADQERQNEQTLLKSRDTLRTREY